MNLALPLEKQSLTGMDRLVALVGADMARVNAMILSRTGSDVAMIPEVAKHLINSGGKRRAPDDQTLAGDKDTVLADGKSGWFGICPLTLSWHLRGPPLD